MNTMLIALIVGLIFVIAKLTIDIFSFLLLIRKDKQIIRQPNELEKNYQFIKGLY
jgi:hypothetical protein